jgi:hypothetical protein
MSVQDRIKVAQTKFKEPYRKMMVRVGKGSRSKWLFAIETFYNMAEAGGWEGVPDESKRNIESASDEDLKYFCKELCTEAINRDFVNWVQTGEEGKVGRTVYSALA